MSPPPLFVGRADVSGFPDPGIHVYFSWNAKDGWERTGYDPGGDEPAWHIRDWQLYSFSPVAPKTVTTESHIELRPGRGGQPFFYILSPVEQGALVSSGTKRLLTRFTERVDAHREDLLLATQELCRRAGVQVPLVPHIVDAYETDLDGDGEKDLLWSSTKADERNTSLYTDPDDYALVGVRQHGKLITLCVVTARTKDHHRPYYEILRPVDIDGDGDMEIFVYDDTQLKLQVYQHFEAQMH